MKGVMKNQTVATLLLATLAIQPQLLAMRVRPDQGVVDGLGKLTYKTGWILLGAVTADSRNWAVGFDPKTDYPTGAFEIVGRNLNRRKPDLPKVGERIRLTARTPVVLLDYATVAEKRRLESPSSVTRSKGPDDETGISLAPGTVVLVRAVTVSRRLGQVRAVWARVSPVAD